MFSAPSEWLIFVRFLSHQEVYKVLAEFGWEYNLNLLNLSQSYVQNGRFKNVRENRRRM